MTITNLCYVLHINNMATCFVLGPGVNFVTRYICISWQSTLTSSPLNTLGQNYGVILIIVLQFAKAVRDFLYQQ